MDGYIHLFNLDGCPDVAQLVMQHGLPCTVVAIHDIKQWGENTPSRQVFARRLESASDFVSCFGASSDVHLTALLRTLTETCDKLVLERQYRLACMRPMMRDVKVLDVKIFK